VSDHGLIHLVLQPLADTVPAAVVQEYQALRRAFAAVYG
jgi:hypothetical protein